MHLCGRRICCLRAQNLYVRNINLIRHANKLSVRTSYVVKAVLSEREIRGTKHWIVCYL